MTFGFRRTSPYFPRCDISAESRGFVGNSFLAGMSVWEFFYTSMQARVDILNKSFLISDAGD
jgi:DNA-directed RNA polymerase beta' subunit